LLRFDGDGTWIWGRSWGATNSEQARGVAVDASGNALLVVRDQAAKKLGGLLKFNAAGSQLSKLEFGKATVDIDPYGISLEASTGGIALQGSVVYSDSSGGPFALVLNSDQTLRWSKQISDPSAPDETFFDSHFAADGWLWLSGSLVNLGIVAWFTSDTMGQRIWAYPASSTYNGFDFASDGTALLAGYSAGPGPNLWVNSVHSTTTLSPTLSVPAADAVVYNAAPTASTGAVTNVVSVASPQQAALVTKFYEPLP